MKPLNRDMHRGLYMSIAIAGASRVAVAGVFLTSAGPAARSGARQGTPGVPYANMPNIAPIGVRVDKYLDVPDFAKGPTVDPAKGYRTQKPVGSQVLELSYHGPGHAPGNIFIYAPKQRTLMVVDVIFPGWMPWRQAKD